MKFRLRSIVHHQLLAVLAVIFFFPHRQTDFRLQAQVIRLGHLKHEHHHEEAAEREEIDKLSNNFLCTWLWWWWCLFSFFLCRGPGVVVLIVSWVITLYTLWQMVEMHEIVAGKRFDRYHELGQEAFGEKLGLWIVVPQQLIVQVGVDIVYMVTGGRSLQTIYTLLCKGHCPLKPHISLWIFIFGSVHFFLSQLPNFNSISGLSLAAAIMSLRWVPTIQMMMIHACPEDAALLLSLKLVWNLLGIPCLCMVVVVVVPCLLQFSLFSKCLCSGEVCCGGPFFVLQLLNNCMGYPCSLWTQRTRNRLGGACWLSSATWSQGRGRCDEHLQCIRNRGICICRTQCGAGDSSHNPIHSRKTFQNSNVARSDVGLHSGCCLLFPSLSRWLLGLWQQYRIAAYWQHPYIRSLPSLAGCSGQFYGYRPCHGKLSGVVDDLSAICITFFSSSCINWAFDWWQVRKSFTDHASWEFHYFWKRFQIMCISWGYMILKRFPQTTWCIIWVFHDSEEISDTMMHHLGVSWFRGDFRHHDTSSGCCIILKRFQIPWCIIWVFHDLEGISENMVRPWLFHNSEEIC